MKLQHFAIGDRFEYDGKVFVKTGPLTAASEQGGQQIIPRYAILSPLSKSMNEEKPASCGQLSESAVRSAFEAFYQSCARLIDASARHDLEAARQQFFAALK